MADSASEPTANSDGADTVRDQFRAALERKKAATKARESHANAGSKVAHPHRPAVGKRQFRRKSG